MRLLSWGFVASKKRLISRRSGLLCRSHADFRMLIAEERGILYPGRERRGIVEICEY